MTSHTIHFVVVIAAVFLYAIVPSIDCRKSRARKTGEWSPWGPWSNECSKQCHPNAQLTERRTRECNQKLRFCRGNRTETRSCERLSSYSCYPEAEFSASKCGTRIPMLSDTNLLKMELLENEFRSALPSNLFVNKRIIRGHAPENPGEYPWLVQFLVGDFVICTGALITPYIVLTAAHCFDLKYEYSLYVGKYRTDPNYYESSAQKLIMKKYLIHKDYDFDTADYDFAIVELEKPAILNYFVNTLCLPDPDQELTENDMCFVAGWGVTAYDTLNYPKTLQELYVPILPESVCFNAFKKFQLFFTSNMVCGGYLNAEADACQGDSGSPLVCKKPSGQFYMGGLVSWGNGCAKKNFPGVYAKVSKATTWVEDYINKMETN